MNKEIDIEQCKNCGAGLRDDLYGKKFNRLAFTCRYIRVFASVK